MLVAVAGCVAQAEGEEIARRAPVVDLVVGPQTYHRLPELIARAREAGERRVDTEFPVEDKFDHLPAPSRAPRGRRGVPDGAGGLRQVLHLLRRALYARRRVLAAGRRRSRRKRARLADAGVVEVTLLGQNVNAYHGVDRMAARELADLLALAAKSTGIERLRYTTSHPRDMADDLIRRTARSRS